MTTALFTLSCAALIAVGYCARLEQQYLPPHVGSGGGSFGSHGGSTSFGSSSGSFSSSSGSFNSIGGSSGGFGGSSAGAKIPILKYENVNNGDGSYRFNYETGNGISAHESGAPNARGPEGPAVTSQGAFSYRAPDGQQISISYTADENGFHPVGPHLPTPPPIPEEILKSIEFNKRNPSSEGAYNPGAGGHGGNSGAGGYHY